MEKIHGGNQRFGRKRHAKSIDVAALEDGLTDESRVDCQDVEGKLVGSWNERTVEISAERESLVREKIWRGEF